MATSFYAKAREKFAQAGINWNTDDIAAVLVDTGAYAFSNDHEFLSSIPQAARISTVQPLTGRTSVGGALDAEDTQFPAVSGPSIESLVIFRRGGSDATSDLILFIDQATGLPITPNGGAMIVNWPGPPYNIARL